VRSGELFFWRLNATFALGGRFFRHLGSEYRAKFICSSNRRRRTQCVPHPPLHAARALNESSQNKLPFAAHLPVNLTITQTPKFGAVKPLHAAQSKGLDVRAASASKEK
jgi:hypothetical protein